jgi:transposase
MCDSWVSGLAELAMIRRRRTGETAARSQHGHVGQKLAAYHDAIRRRVSAQPDATLDELRAWMLASHGVSVSQGGMWNVLDRMGLTLKKRRNSPPSRGGLMLPRPAQLGPPTPPSLSCYQALANTAPDYPPDAKWV